jgi:hypothetical protein
MTPFRRFAQAALIMLLLVILINPPRLLARDQREQARINYLIDSLGNLKGAVFIRNGSEYEAKAAKDHLLTKLNYAGERVKTAEQFIKYLATESSMSHRPYQIRLVDGTTVSTAQFFGEKLKEFDQKSH